MVINAPQPRKRTGYKDQHCIDASSRLTSTSTSAHITARIRHPRTDMVAKFLVHPFTDSRERICASAWICSPDVRRTDTNFLKFRGVFLFHSLLSLARHCTVPAGRLSIRFAIHLPGIKPQVATANWTMRPWKRRRDEPAERLAPFLLCNSIYAEMPSKIFSAVRGQGRMQNIGRTL